MQIDNGVEYALISKEEIGRLITLANQICLGAKSVSIERPGKSAEMLTAANKLKEGLSGFWGATVFGQVEVVPGNEYRLKSQTALDVGRYGLLAVQDMFSSEESIH